MAELTTNYLGLTLKNPIIVGASNLVTDLGNLKKIEDVGAAAIVYKSLFEEQIQLENLQMHEQMSEYRDRNAEMVSLFPDIEHAGPEEHLFNLARAKKSISIPLIASLNAVYDKSWVEYAKKIEEVGVDALELNFYSVPVDMNTSGQALEAREIDIIRAVKAAVSIPVSVKLSSFYANPLHVISRMDEAGADGFVLFNNLFQPEIDIDREEHFYPYNLSNEDDHKLALRFAGLLYGNLNGQVCSNGGIYTGKDVAKLLLAGADSVQIVSTLYKNHIGHISSMIMELEGWMENKGYKTISDFRGKLSRKNTKETFAYKRAQYVDILMHSEEIFKKYPMV